MRYVSTRGKAPYVGFNELLLAGLAPDGGLYVPEIWPVLESAEIRGLRGESYAAVAEKIVEPFVGDLIPQLELRRLLEATYEEFEHPEVAPLHQLSSNEWVLELFHGPTLAFKDFALQLLGRLFEYSHKIKGGHITIIGATSGDTGSAAINACKGMANLDVFMLHPKDRVSKVQRRQMTTVSESNIHNIAIEGTFDDCQAIVKAMFNHSEFRQSFGLTAVNSINWARIMSQVTYYFYAATALGAPDQKVTFSVPTGNFGNVYAGYAAYCMGLPVRELVIGTNQNDILARFFENAEYKKGKVFQTISPSMDIQVSSNFERLLFERMGRDGGRVAKLMEELDAKGKFRVSSKQFESILDIFSAYAVSEDQTVAAMSDVWNKTGILIDPHTAVGLVAARSREHSSQESVVVLATAHPAKFPESVEFATGRRPELPDHLSDLYDRTERYDVLPNDLESVQGYIRKTLSI